MEITGLISKQSYSEKDILNITMYARMKCEPLVNGDGALVIPVLNKKAPHFRRIGEGMFKSRIGVTEVDPTHKEVVTSLKTTLGANRLKVITRVYEDTTSTPAPYEEQVIFCAADAKHYKWFAEKECRIAFEGGNYIEPDIAGRNLEILSPSIGTETIIIEVIQTHYPEQETFFRLLSLSAIGHLVVFYFVAPGNHTSKFNRYKIQDGVIEMYPAYYLARGCIFKNGNEWTRPKNITTDGQWYSYLEAKYFRHAMEHK